MANITLAGTLRDPNGDLAVGDKIRFTHKSTTGETVKSASSILTIDPTGVYSVDLEYGLVLVEYKDVRNSQFDNLGVATVNGDNPATSIPELLNALVPVSSAELIEFQSILADCVAAKDAAEAAAATLDLINDLSQTYIFDTVALFKSSLIVFPDGKTIHLNDRDADFIKITGTGTANTFNIIASTSVNQSINLIVGDSVNVTQWGAIADGVGGTDNTGAFEACRDYCISNSLKMFAPDGVFWFVGDIDLWGVHKIKFNCIIAFTNDTFKMVVGGNTSSAPSMSLDIYAVNGICQVYGMNRGDFKLNSAFTLHLFASDAIANRNTVSYSRFEWVNVNTLHLECQDTLGGIPWINENKFYAGRVRVNFLMDGTYPMNNNIFYGMCMESMTIDVQIGQNNHFHDVRLEGTNTFNFGATTFNNIFWQTWSNFANTMIWDLPASTYNITDLGDNNRIVPVHYAYTEKDVPLLVDINNLGNNGTFEISGTSADKVKILLNASTFFDTGLLAVTDKVWGMLEGELGVASFFYTLGVYDLNGDAIVIEPASGFKTSQGSTSWNALGYWEYTTPIAGGAYAVNPIKDANVKYIRLIAKTDNGAAGDEHTSIKCIVVQSQQNKCPIKNLVADKVNIDIISSKVTATSEATATDLIKFTSATTTTADAVGILAGRLDVIVSAEKGSIEDASYFSVDMMITREDAGNLVLTSGTPSQLTNGGTLQINGITLAEKAGSSPSELIVTIAISTNKTDPFDALNTRARLVGLTDWNRDDRYIISAEKV